MLGKMRNYYEPPLNNQNQFATASVHISNVRKYDLMTTLLGT
jgi:hypothetical protein